jgi:hypothetical protein
VSADIRASRLLCFITHLQSALVHLRSCYKTVGFARTLNKERVSSNFLTADKSPLTWLYSLIQTVRVHCAMLLWSLLTKTRWAVHLRGLTPPALDESLHLTRCLAQLRSKDKPIEKYIYLSQLKDADARSFYKLCGSHMEEITPLIYTPTVGDACLQFSHIYRRPEGLVCCSQSNLARLDG